MWNRAAGCGQETESSLLGVLASTRDGAYALAVSTAPHSDVGVNSRSNSEAPGEQWPPLTWASIRRGAANEEEIKVEAGWGTTFLH